MGVRRALALPLPAPALWDPRMPHHPPLHTRSVLGLVLGPIEGHDMERESGRERRGRKEVIRHALSRALVYYYPIAGRLCVGAGDQQDHLLVSCTGEGVLFIAAFARCSLRELGMLDVPLKAEQLLSELAPRYGDRRRLDDPPLMVQVTEFSCGGYLVGVTWNHAIADGFGMAQFLRAVGEFARGLPAPSILPFRYDLSLRDIPQPALASPQRPRADLATCDVTVPWSFVARVKAEWRRRQARYSACTVFEAVTAAVWWCRARAIRARPGTPTCLVFTANVRRFVGAKHGYYGNCITSRLVSATSGAVAHGSVLDLVKLIKDAKERIPTDLIAGPGKKLDDEALVDTLRGYYNALYVSSWGGLGMDGVDFGSGMPVRVVPAPEKMVAPLCVACLPCTSVDDGVSAVTFCVTEEHVVEFEAELARLS
ncbi:hypothetical protein HU200_038450 [Digitaria exilis]|uniref:Uncharacterized protein n=1 Tax=Digitaria exilis TaxID=1010633 RepID=A0A835BKJ9_9POAL|nr:hypothetical protein HU200_038450 [Digitaria exilis]